MPIKPRSRCLFRLYGPGIREIVCACIRRRGLILVACRSLREIYMENNKGNWLLMLQANFYREPRDMIA